MRGVLTAKKLPRVSVLDGSGESMPSVKDASIDAVFVAQVGQPFLGCTLNISYLPEPTELRIIRLAGFPLVRDYGRVERDSPCHEAPLSIGSGLERGGLQLAS